MPLKTALKSSSAAALICALSASAAHAQDSADDVKTAPARAVSKALENIVVTGTRIAADDVAGSISFIGPDELAKQDYSDITRLLRAVPGVNLQEEDGYGLRPNIGLRGSGADRSSKIVIMEDGVLMAPAAYSAPAAYYFPSTARMNAVEVTKGPATVKYGPNTTAGAINLFSTPIPDSKAAHGEVMVSSQNRVPAHAWVGDRIDAGSFDIGYLLETYQDKAQGFKDLPRGGDTGFLTQDYVGKVGLFSKDGRQSLEFKIQQQDEDHDETYVGLTQGDFDTDPYQRYAASALDNFIGEHKTYQATHNIDITENWNLTTLAYQTRFARNWTKLDKFDNSLLSGSGACNSIDEILRDPGTCASEIEVLRGAAGYVSPDDVLGIRQNNRAYKATGIQMALAGDLDFAGVTHALTISARYHEDEVSRFQEQDQYRIDNGTLIKTTDNAPGTQANRVSDAKALSAYIEDRITWDRLTVTAGVRLEDVDTAQDRWDTPDRTLAPDSSRANSYTEVLPSLAALYDVTDTLSVYGGVHRGFSAAPVSSRESTDPEESTVYEGGLRYRGAGGISIEATAFFNDYSNLLGSCTNSSGGSDCDIGDAFNAGEVEVKGLELTAGTDAAQWFGTSLDMPVSLAYTYTDSEITSTFSDSFWGDVIAGDELPYVPENQLTLSAGVQAELWEIEGVISAVSEARNVAGQGSIDAAEKIGSHTLLDLSATWHVSDAVSMKLKAENATNSDYVAARNPYGLRPGKPREIFIGVVADF